MTTAPEGYPVNDDRHPDFEPVGVLNAAAQAVAALRAAGLDWDMAALKKFLARAGAVGIVLRDRRSLSRRPVAVLLAYARRTTTLKHLAVAPAYRRRGAAKYLLRLLDDVVRLDGRGAADRALVAKVPETDLAALCLLRSCGWEVRKARATGRPEIKRGAKGVGGEPDAPDVFTLRKTVRCGDGGGGEGAARPRPYRRAP